MRMLRHWLFALLCVFTLPPALAVGSAVGELLPQASPLGSGSFRWFGLKLYDARLWAERRSFNGNEWMRTPLALELTYARTLYGARIAEASIDEMKKLGLGSAAQHRAWLDAMKQVFPNVEEGTQLIGLYQPGHATRFYRDGVAVGEVADPEFGPAFFAIWLHPRTSAPKLRAALLGKP
jgi:hypothetical protein